MNLLQSIAGNKTILNVALKQITGSMEKDGISCIVIVRDPDNKDEDSNGLSIKTYKEAVGILEGDDLEQYVELRERMQSGNALVLSGEPLAEYMSYLSASEEYERDKQEPKKEVDDV